MGVVTVTIFFPSFRAVDKESRNLNRRSRAGNSSRQAPVAFEQVTDKPLPACVCGCLGSISGKVSQRPSDRLLSQLNPEVGQKVYIGAIVSRLSGR
jgi:hypothetical protein